MENRGCRATGGLATGMAERNTGVMWAIGTREARCLEGVTGMASVGDVCKKDLAFDRCLRSVDAERNRGNSVILFAPCFVLADGAGTALALCPLLWGLCSILRGVERLRSVDRHPNATN